MERSQAEHLVRRTSFGTDWALVDQLTPLSRSAAVDEILDFGRNPGASPPASVMAAGGTHWMKVRDLSMWWMERMRTVPRPFQELLALFWHSHFATHTDKVEHAKSMAEQLQLFRAGTLGSFRDLVQAVSISPAMLLYLDNYLNEAIRPNENFARELLELHMLSPGNYTERDVIETARAWTGHQVDGDRSSYRFKASEHDSGSKSIFGVVRNFDGPDVVDEALLGVKRTPAARFLAGKLWSHLAYPNPSRALVDELIVPYLSSGLDLRVLLRAILNHDAFYSDAARKGVVRQPVHWAVACLAGGRIEVSEGHPERYVGSMGQKPFYPPTPEGWGLTEEWIAPSVAWARADFARAVADQMQQKSYLKEITSQPPNTAVETLRRAFGVPSLSPATRSAIESYLVAERAGSNDDQFKNAVTLMMLSPEMQMA